MDDVWIRLDTGWEPSRKDDINFGWALWRPDHIADPWPHDELGPGFAYYVCEKPKDGRLGIAARAVVEYHLPPTMVASVADAYLLVCNNLFDCHFAIEPELWLDNLYNTFKAYEAWPQVVTAWRSITEPVAPPVFPGPRRFPHTGWLRKDKIAL